MNKHRWGIVGLISWFPVLILYLTLSQLTAQASLNIITLTVCIEGPPICDYPTIQQAIDASQPDDTILVSPGTYSQQLTLKSGLTIQSTDGQLSTTLLAPSEPIINAKGITSTHLDGFTLDGQNTISRSIDIQDSSLTLNNLHIKNFEGAASVTTTKSHGKPSTGILITNTGHVTIMNSLIEFIQGGHGTWSYPNFIGANGADGDGIRAVGNITLTVLDTTIQRISGGGAASGGYCSYAGSGTGIRTLENVHLTVLRANLNGFEGGYGCESYNAVYGTGIPRGIFASGGYVTVLNSQITDFIDGVSKIGIQTENTLGTHIAGNVIRNCRNCPPGYQPLSETQLTLHPLNASPATAIASFGDAYLLVQDNYLADLNAGGTGYHAIAIDVQDTYSTTIMGNEIAQLRGGSTNTGAAGGQLAEGYGIGVNLNNVNQANVSQNYIHDIEGGTAQGTFNRVERGGDAIGIKLVGVAEAYISNNMISQLTGGEDDMYGYASGAGGGYGVHVMTSTAKVINNSLHFVLPGEPNTPSAGFYFLDMANVSAYNNTLSEQIIGIKLSLLAVVSADFNNYWFTETDYDGISAGLNDFSVDPVFDFGTKGQLYLNANSPLIDVGTNNDLPFVDFDGEPRTSDGNNDNLAVPDIGADEVWLGVSDSFIQVNKLIANPGDELIYTVTIANASDWIALPNVNLTNPIPLSTTFVTGSLIASGGSWGYQDGTISWTGSITPGGQHTLRFRVLAQSDISNTVSIINRTTLVDSIGIRPRIIQVFTLINPKRLYLPTIQFLP